MLLAGLLALGGAGWGRSAEGQAWDRPRPVGGVGRGVDLRMDSIARTAWTRQEEGFGQGGVGPGTPDFPYVQPPLPEPPVSRGGGRGVEVWPGDARVIAPQAGPGVGIVDPVVVGGTCEANALPSSLLVLVDQLVCETDAFIRCFGPTAHLVPDGRLILRTAEDLYCSATRYRAVLFGELPACDARKVLRELTDNAGRLHRRVDRVSKGRTGPNIRQVHRIADLAFRIRQCSY